jgi:hypothetical protein
MIARDLITEPDILDMETYGDPGMINGLLKSGSFVRENQPVFEVIQAFADLKTKVIPVLSENNQYLGTVTLEKLVRSLARITSVETKGGIIVLEVNTRDYSLSHLAQIVEANDARVLSAYITSFPEPSRLEVTLKVNTQEIGPILQTFDRYGYTVKASYSNQDAYTETIRERYDALMNFLNI